jgi:hypothetical protein
VSGSWESVVEQATRAWLESTGWASAHGPDLAPEIHVARRRDESEVEPAHGRPPDLQSADTGSYVLPT